MQSDLKLCPKCKYERPADSFIVDGVTFETCPQCWARKGRTAHWRTPQHVARKYPPKPIRISR